MRHSPASRCDAKIDTSRIKLANRDLTVLTPDKSGWFRALRLRKAPRRGNRRREQRPDKKRGMGSGEWRDKEKGEQGDKGEGEKEKGGQGDKGKGEIVEDKDQPLDLNSSSPCLPLPLSPCLLVSPLPIPHLESGV